MNMETDHSDNDCLRVLAEILLNMSSVDLHDLPNSEIDVFRARLRKVVEVDGGYIE